MGIEEVINNYEESNNTLTELRDRYRYTMAKTMSFGLDPNSDGIKEILLHICNSIKTPKEYGSILQKIFMMCELVGAPKNLKNAMMILNLKPGEQPVFDFQ